MGLSSGRMTYDPHLEDDSQIREIWELGTERPKWPCLLMNALGERVWVCFLAYNGTQGHFHYDVCIWRHKCSGLGVLTSLSHGLVCVSLFLFCKAYCSWHSRSWARPGVGWTASCFWWASCFLGCSQHLSCFNRMPLSPWSLSTSPSLWLIIILHFILCQPIVHPGVSPVV